MLEINWHELLSWVMVVIGATAFLYERKKNDNMKHYMAIQGLMQSYFEKSKKYANLVGDLNRGKIDASKETMELMLKTVYSETRETVAMLFGIMKSLDIKKDLPFDVELFLKQNIEDNIKNSPKSKK